jgi:hypothetical protein
VTTDAESPFERLAVASNRLERLDLTRQAFRVMAAGDRVNALRAAKAIADETERETALLALVTEWTEGKLQPPWARARLIDRYGLEAGLGFELLDDPVLAKLWAVEMTEGGPRSALLQQVAVAMTGLDPAGALALSAEIPPEERAGFREQFFAGWANRDTEAALQWASQINDPAEHEAALRAIRSVAPVGIGAALSLQNGLPVINGLLPGTPAESSGRLRPGDRIVALAQGNDPFVPTQGLDLQQIVGMIRGAPGTWLQLQILRADAVPGAAPETVPLLRDQIKFKQ